MTRSHAPLDWQRAATSPRIMYVLIAAAVLGLVIGLDTLALHAQADPLADVHAYYNAGTRLNAGLPLYEQGASTDDADFYRYPPLLAIAFRPLALLPFEQAAFLWEAVLIVAFVLTVLRLGLRRRWTWLVLGWLAAPIAWSLAVGQAQVLVTWFLTIGSPLAVACAAHLKIFPVLVAVYWAGRRDVVALRRLTIWLVALMALSFILEPRGTVAFLGFPNLDQVGDVRNLSPYEVSPMLWAALVLGLVVIAWRLSSTRLAWAAAVILAVFATPRLLMYQFSTLLAASRDTADYTAPDARAK